MVKITYVFKYYTYLSFLQMVPRPDDSGGSGTVAAAEGQIWIVPGARVAGEPGRLCAVGARARPSATCHHTSRGIIYVHIIMLHHYLYVIL